MGRHNVSPQGDHRPVTRNIFLVRHGNYDGSSLTRLGRRQSKLTGNRLRELNYPYSRIVHSTVTRAIETSEIIQRYLSSSLVVQEDDILREGKPIITSHRSGKRRINRDFQDAYEKYFHPADPTTQKKDSFDIIVCHSNIIRYFLCRVLGMDVSRWRNFCPHHCSISWVTISSEGRAKVNFIGDTGHIPRCKMSKK